MTQKWKKSRKAGQATGDNIIRRMRITCSTTRTRHTLEYVILISFPQQPRLRERTSVLDCVWNVMAHAPKPDFVFRRNGRVHLNRRELLAAEVCASAVVMLDTPCSEVVWRVLATHSICQFPFTSLPCVTVCHHISTGPCLYATLPILV